MASGYISHNVWHNMLPDSIITVRVSNDVSKPWVIYRKLFNRHKYTENVIMSKGTNIFRYSICKVSIQSFR